jgi:PAS domain S-box-containing protein
LFHGEGLNEPLAGRDNTMDTSHSRTNGISRPATAGRGGMDELIHAFNWSRTPLGPRDRWPVSLRTVVETLMASQFPMALLWGPELILIYNDAYGVICADKHPVALGRSTREVWSEVWHINESIFAAVMERGESLHFEDKLFSINRRGCSEDAYFTLCYSPVRIEDGSIGGTLVVLQETTGCKRAEEVLDESRRFTLATIDALSAHICVLDAAGRIVTVNRAWRAFAAANPPVRGNVAEGANYLAVCDAATGSDAAEAAAFAAGIRAVMGGERDEFALEYPCHSPDKQRWFIGCATPFAGAGPAYIVVSHENITERKQAEEALRESEERYRAVVEDQTEVISRFKADGRFTFVNNFYCRFFGKTNKELIGKRWQPSVVPEDLPLIERELRALAPSRPVATIENRVYSGSGEVRWMQFVNRGFFNAEGQLIEIQSVGRDITERKQAEAALAESETRYRTVADFTYDWEYWMGADGRLLYVSPSCQRITSHAAEEFLDDPDLLLRIVHADDRTAVEEHLTIERGAEKPTELEYRVVARDETVRWIQHICQPVFNTDGQLLGRRANNREITERKRLEKMTQTFAHELLTAREEERKQVSAALHHDVGSLAVGLAAHLDAVEAEIHSGRPGAALRGVKRTRKLIDQTVRRLKQVAVQLRPPELDVVGLRAALRQHFAGVTQQGQIRIRFRETLGRKYLVSGDNATILFRVAQEALTNAMTHGRAKRVEVNLGAAKGQVRLTLRDYGKGFDPTDPGVETASRMGLRVMREMAAAAGGVFQVDSRPGHGTTVRASLPLQAVKARPAAMAPPTTARGPAAHSTMRGARAARRKRT